MMHGLMTATLTETHSLLVIQMAPELMKQHLMVIMVQLMLVLTAKDSPKRKTSNISLNCKQVPDRRMMHGLMTAIRVEIHLLLAMETQESMPQHLLKLESNAKDSLSYLTKVKNKSEDVTTTVE